MIAMHRAPVRGLLLVFCLMALGAEGRGERIRPASLPTPNDPGYHEMIGDHLKQWPLHHLHAVEAWSLYPGRYYTALDRPQNSPLIALIDTGVDSSHPDFINLEGDRSEVAEGGQLELSLARVFLSGDRRDLSSDITDEHGHGTHLAGIIAAAANNGATASSGIAGLGYPARLLPLKVAGPDGAATHSDLARAIVYAADSGADIIFIGLAGPTWSHILQEAVDYAWERGCFLIAPIGDTADSTPSYPASCPHVFAASALTVAGELTSYSSYGNTVALSAPGGDRELGVYSTLPTYACTLRTELHSPPYGWLSGSSQAAAHVAAAAGLYLGANPGLNSSQQPNITIWQALQRAAATHQHFPAHRSDEFGWGALALLPLLEGTAPESDRGDIVGRVMLSGAPEIEAVIVAIPHSGAAAASTTVSRWPAGAFRLTGLAPGKYRIEAHARGLAGLWEEVDVIAGCDTPGIGFSLGDLPANASLLYAELPEAAVRNRSFSIRIGLKNTGQSTWTRHAGYCIKHRTDYFVSDIDQLRIWLSPDENCFPDEELHLSIELQAPMESGFYLISLQMCQEGGQSWFGDIITGSISITSFLDVPADHWALREIEATVAADIVRGYEDDTYRPSLLVSRDQMAVFIARALVGGDANIPSPPIEPTYLDITSDHWAFPYIEYVSQEDIAQGYPDGCFYPETPLDRGQMAVFIARAVAGGESSLASFNPPKEPTFHDVPQTAWMYHHVEYIAERSIVLGYPDGTYHPDSACTRDQMAVYLGRAFGLL